MEYNQIERIMKGLNCSRAEAEQIAQEDKNIDRGLRTSFDLPPEMEKIAKKMANSTTKEQKSPKSAPKRKENPVKSQLITEISNFLAEKGYENVEIINKECQIMLKVNEKSYEIKLIEKRK